VAVDIDEALADGLLDTRPRGLLDRRLLDVPDDGVELFELVGACLLALEFRLALGECALAGDVVQCGLEGCGQNLCEFDLLGTELLVGGADQHHPVRAHREHDVRVGDARAVHRGRRLRAGDRLALDEHLPG
jgi:hypothetical protein